MTHRPLCIVFAATLILLEGLSTHAIAQQRIDGSFPFQSDPAKKYSLYIPSGYEQGTPHRLMIGFHALNVARWNAASWCDTLVAFAEANDLLLACPDGGDDGRIDDPIDFAFTEVLLDSVAAWYSIDAAKRYAMGFSWGGRATYTFGLTHAGIFGGFVPIGAAINGTTEVQGIIQNAEGKPFYLVHGANDSPNIRYWPIRQALIDNGAIVNSILMPGVGHTIDFPNRNEILGVAFQWVDSVNCAFPPAAVEDPNGGAPEVLGWGSALQLARNPVPTGGTIRLLLIGSGVPDHAGFEHTLELFDSQGRRLGSWAVRSTDPSIPAPATRGTYLLRLRTSGGRWSAKVIVE